MLSGKYNALLLESGKFSGLKEKIAKDFTDYCFHECEEGYKAIDLISESKDQGKTFDLIVLDFPSSDFSRFELFSFLKSTKYDARYLMITGMNGKVHLEPFSLKSEYDELVKRYQTTMNLDSFNDVLTEIQVKK